MTGAARESRSQNHQGKAEVPQAGLRQFISFGPMHLVGFLRRPVAEAQSFPASSIHLKTTVGLLGLAFSEL